MTTAALAWGCIQPVSGPGLRCGCVRRAQRCRRRWCRLRTGCRNGGLPAQRLTRAALTAKLPDGGVERRQLTCMLFEQSLEPRHALGVGRDRGQVSVVEPRIDPGSIAAAYLILPLERAHVLARGGDRKSTRLNSSHLVISYA